MNNSPTNETGNPLEEQSAEEKKPFRQEVSSPGEDHPAQAPAEAPQAPAETQEFIAAEPATVPAAPQAAEPAAAGGGLQGDEMPGSALTEDVPTGQPVPQPGIASVEETGPVTAPAETQEFIPAEPATVPAAPATPDEPEAGAFSQAEAAEEEEDTAETPDFASFSPRDYVVFLEKQLADLQANRRPAGADTALKAARQSWEQHRSEERRQQQQHFIDNGGQEADFTDQPDETTRQAEGLFGRIRSLRNQQHQQAEKSREDNFNRKTELLNTLRQLVEQEEQTGEVEKSWDAFKQLQADWKAAGNIPSPHNNTLWQTYHALVDRYFNNRNIYFELKELDRKRNMQQKIDLIEKIEKIAADAEQQGISGKVLNEASELFEEFKHIGPAPREVNDELWKRVKAPLDGLYQQKREQNEGFRQQAEAVFQLKADIASVAETFTGFQSGSINDWADKTRALMAVQEQWNAVKGPMPRQKGRELSQKFWNDVKTFFRHKGEFFKQLEARRDENLRQKTQLCEQAEALLASGEESAEATQQMIELQRRWKGIGHVPEKMRDKIFDRFKAAADAFFDRKRNRHSSEEKSYEENLSQKQALLEEIEQAATQPDTSLETLTELKARFAAIGFVPRRDLQKVQQRYVKAINAYITSLGKLSSQEKEKLMLQSETEAPRGGGERAGHQQGSRMPSGRETDLRKRIRSQEDEIAQMENNMAFFGRSKNADQIRSDFEKRIDRARQELERMKDQLRSVREAE